MHSLQFIPIARQEGFRAQVLKYFESLKKYLLSEHKSLQKREKENKRLLRTKGEITEERAAENDQAQKAYEKLLTSMGTLAVSWLIGATHE